MLFSRSFRSFWMVLALCPLLVSAGFDHLYGPGSGTRGESIGGTGAQFGVGDCGYLSNAGAAGLPQMAYGQNSSQATNPIPTPATTRPADSFGAAQKPAGAEPTPAAAKSGEPAGSTAKSSSSTDTDSSSTADKKARKNEDKKDTNTATADAENIKKLGEAAMAKCVSCHQGEAKNAGAPQSTTLSSLPESMPPKGSSMTPAERQAFQRYLDLNAK